MHAHFVEDVGILYNSGRWKKERKNLWQIERKKGLQRRFLRLLIFQNFLYGNKDYASNVDIKLQNAVTMQKVNYKKKILNLWF